MTQKFVSDLWEIWNALRKTEQGILADGNYTAEGQNAMREAARREARKLALEAARGGLEGLKNSRSQAREALRQSELDALRRADTQKQLLVSERAKAAANDAGRLLALVERAIALRDYDQLQAAYDFALPALRDLVGAHYADGFLRQTLSMGDVNNTERALAAALLEAEPEALKRARAALKQIEDEAQQAVRDVRSFSWQISEVGGLTWLVELERGPAVTLAGSIEAGRWSIGAGQSLLDELAEG